MKIDWDALLPPRVVETAPAKATPAAPDAAGEDREAADREAWEERAAIIEFDGGLDRRTAEALATVELCRGERAAVWKARAGDDRRYCPECGQFRDGRCTIAKPGGLVSAVRGYQPVPDILQRCVGFAPLPDDPDQRPGVVRWAWMMQPPAASPAPRQLDQSLKGRASA